mmetsp:Transcript_57621/g.132311  ORF Transcript_57621/g.132311 Transcript_57621/m.132311 type:complete len:192 (-) Transcript_57621:143-718(-)
MVATTVRPCEARNDMMPTTSSAIAESRPVVGSSKKRIGGLVMSARPMLTRFFWPPEMPFTSAPPIFVWRQLCSWSSRRTSSTRCTFSALASAGSLSSAVYMSICSTVRSSTRLSNCSTYPQIFLRSCCLTAAPAKRIVPPIVPEFLRPDSTSIRLVLPQPLGPKRAHIRPGRKQPSSASRMTLVSFLICTE